MKTIFKDGVYDRVIDEVGESKVKFHGWKYVPKSEWKKNSRDVKTEEQKEEEVKKEKTKSKKTIKRSKFKNK